MAAPVGNLNGQKKAPSMGHVRAPWESWKGSMLGKRIRFIESQCIVPKGHNAGKKVVLADYQKELIERFTAEGIRTAMEQLPRGNAKSTTVACLALSELFLNPYSPSIPICATKIAQAEKAIYNPAARMVKLNPELEGRTQVYSANGAKRLYVGATDGEMFPMASDVDGLQGLDPSMAFFDEIGFIEQDSWDALKLAAGKRPESLVCGLGTPSFNHESALYLTRERVQHGVAIPGFDFIEYSGDPDCDIHDRSQWYQANPALKAGILSIDALESDVLSTPEASFRVYRLAQWAEGNTEGWLGERGKELWSATTDEYAFSPTEPTFVGVDLSKRHDCSAVVWGQERPDGRFHVKAKIWYPTDKETIDPNEVKSFLQKLHQDLNLVQVGYDERYMELMARQLDDEGLAMIEFPQSLERMTPAVMGAHQAIVAGTLSHDDDPVFASHVYNAVPQYSERGFTLAKRKSRSKIDAAVAMCMCHALGASSDDRPLDLATLFHV